jgi:hypothetical protein
MGSFPWDATLRGAVRSGVATIAPAEGKTVTTVVSRFCSAATAMAATTAVLMICVLPPALEARRPYVKRSGRPRRREAFVYAADNRTRPAAEAPLFRFALVGDTHYWMPTDRRAAFLRVADGRASRDGLLVGDSPAVLQVVLGQLTRTRTLIITLLRRAAGGAGPAKRLRARRRPVRCAHWRLGLRGQLVPSPSPSPLP